MAARAARAARAALVVMDLHSGAGCRCRTTWSFDIRRSKDLVGLWHFLTSGAQRTDRSKMLAANERASRNPWTPAAKTQPP